MKVKWIQQVDPWLSHHITIWLKELLLGAFLVAFVTSLTAIGVRYLIFIHKLLNEYCFRRWILHWTRTEIKNIGPVYETCHCACVGHMCHSVLWSGGGPELKGSSPVAADDVCNLLKHCSLNDAVCVYTACSSDVCCQRRHFWCRDGEFRRRPR